MKKQMRDENLMKISELADRSVTDSSVANVLLCYMLYRVNAPLESELLYEIAVTEGIINYFTYQDSLETLLQNGSVICKTNDKGEKLYSLTDNGIDCAKKLKTFAAKSYRDHIVLAAKRSIERRKNEDVVMLDYIPLKQGCHLRVRIMDHDLLLLELTLYTPDMRQAKLLGERILSNPSAFYNNVLQSAMQNEAVPVDLTDN